MKFQEWNGRQSFIPIPYWISFIVFTEKYIGIVENIILTKVLNICSIIICRQIAVVWLRVLRQQRTVCVLHRIGTLQFAGSMLCSLQFAGSMLCS